MLDPQTLACVECGRADDGERGWRLTRVDLDEFAWYCPKCWAREFGDQSESDRRRFS
jgi:hypothetical protein